MDGKPGKPELVIFILSPAFLVFPFLFSSIIVVSFPSVQQVLYFFYYNISSAKNLVFLSGFFRRPLLFFS